LAHAGTTDRIEFIETICPGCPWVPGAKPPRLSGQSRSRCRKDDTTAGAVCLTDSPMP